jgi:hypothetical protein
MAIDRPQAIADAPLGPERSAGWRWRDFLGSRGMGAAEVPRSRVASPEKERHAAIAASRSRLVVLGRDYAIKRPHGSRLDSL